MINSWIYKYLLAFLALATFSVTISSVQAMPQVDRAKQKQKQDEKEQEEKLATIRGSLVLDSDIVKDFEWETMEGELGQLVAMRQPPFPEGFADLSVEKKQAWLTAYYESDAGKKLQERNQKALEERHVQTFGIRSKGKFVVYDVPKGRFEMRVLAQATVDDKTYVLQSYGQFDVGEVDELDFSNMKLDVLRLLQMGEEAPEVSGMSSAGRNMSLSDLRGKHVLLAFGLTANKDFETTTRLLKEAKASTESGDKLSVLTITVDEDMDAVAEFNRKNGVDWNCINLGKWDQKVLNSYGLKSVPSVWLLDPEGKIVLTSQQFIFEINRTKFSLSKVVDETIAGRLTIGGEKEEETPEDGEANEKGSMKKAPGKRNP